MREQKRKENTPRIRKSGRILLPVIFLLALTACGKEEPATREPIPDRKTEATTETEVLLGDGNWVNLNEISFYVNDHKYVLGKNTIWDIVRDGNAVYDVTSEGADAILKPDEKSSRFTIKLAEGWGVSLYTKNIGDDDHAAADCAISELNFIMDEKEMKENRLGFTFPLSITPEELQKTAGKPSKLEDYMDDKLGDVYDTYIYKYRNMSYTFKFTNKELMVVELKYNP